MADLRRPSASLRLPFLLATALVVALAPVAAEATNSTDVDGTLTLTFQGVVFTSSGNPAMNDSEYDFDSIDNFGNAGSFEQGTGSQSSSASVAVNGTAWDAFFGPLFIDDEIVITLAADASATSPGSNFTGTYTDNTTVFFNLLTDDEFTFVFDYELVWNMTLSEPDPGQVAGTFQADAEEMAGGGLFADYIDFGIGALTGQTVMPNGTESGQLSFDIDNSAGNNDFVEVLFTTRVSASAQQAVPEPATFSMLAAGLALLALGRRSSRLRA